MKEQKNRGITLIALVITIIVLLILTGVSIVALTGQNGLLTKANTAKVETAKKSAEEKVKVAVAGSFGTDGRINLGDLNTNLRQVEGLTEILFNGTSIWNTNEITSLPIEVLVDGYRFKITENGKAQEIKGIFLNYTELKMQEGKEKQLVATLTKEVESSTIEWSILPANEKITVENGLVRILEGATIGTTVKVAATVTGTSYSAECTVTVKETIKLVSGKVYYADFDTTDEKIDGVIFADLTKGSNGEKQWGDSNGKYTIPNNVTNAKEYSVSKSNYSDALTKFGAGDVLTVSGNETGEDRFYVMALSDISTSPYYWYQSAISAGMSDWTSYTSVEFGKGKENTTKMITKWNVDGYGSKNTSSDLWGQIQTQVDSGWFVPSKAEWSAFSGELGINKENYGSKGLSRYYWSSSQGSAAAAWYAEYYLDCMRNPRRPQPLLRPPCHDFLILYKK